MGTLVGILKSLPLLLELLRDAFDFMKDTATNLERQKQLEDFRKAIKKAKEEHNNVDLNSMLNGGRK